MAASELEERFKEELVRTGLYAEGSKQETRIGGKLTEFSFTYQGRGTEGTLSVLDCDPSSWVVVSQTLE